MRIATIAILIILSGCTTDLCPEQLTLTEDTRIQRGDIPDLASFNKVVSTSYSQGGEVHVLEVYDAQERYYVQFRPAHFSDQRVYGPFNGSWQEGIHCDG